MKLKLSLHNPMFSELDRYWTGKVTGLRFTGQTGGQTYDVINIYIFIYY